MEALIDYINPYLVNYQWIQSMGLLMILYILCCATPINDNLRNILNRIFATLILGALAFWSIPAVYSIFQNY